jgi:hypothetical protein
MTLLDYVLNIAWEVDVVDITMIVDAISVDFPSVIAMNTYWVSNQPQGNFISSNKQYKLTQRKPLFIKAETK